MENLISADQVKSKMSTLMKEEKTIRDFSAEDRSSIKASILSDMPNAVKQLDSLRTGGKDRRAVDLSFADFVKERWGFAPSENGSPDSFYNLINVDPSNATIESLMTMPEFPEGYRWIVPEVIREAIRLGLRRNPIYPNLIAAEETVSQPTVIMPSINKSDATMKRVGEAETIPVGSVSFGQKTVTIYKAGIGLEITDEVRQFVALNVLSIFLQDVGVNLNLAIDTMAIETLVNGDQAGGGAAAAVVGTASGTDIDYDNDLLGAWIKMGRLGKMPDSILGNETSAKNLLALPEFKGFNGMATVRQKLDLQTAIPASQKVWIHGSMPAGDKIMLVDSSSALIKLNATALKVESERIAQRQISGTYVTITTGFANIFNDARLILDGTQTIGAAPYPSYFDVSAAEAAIQIS